MNPTFLRIEPPLQRRFPGLEAHLIRLRGIKVEETNRKLEALKEEAVRRARGRWRLEELRDHPIIRAYRDFFWRLGLDPTKIRPAAEALLRRVLHGRSLPRINTAVDAYNLVSLQSLIALAAFDGGRVVGEPYMREAEAGEEFLGIGMERPKVLRGGEPVISDGEKLLALYPYRDADSSKITLETKEMLLLVCGVPGIDRDVLLEAGRLAVRYITRFCGGVEA
jgi:DNA/RNA-binding domain of Phe-tRNA-synthetase-like protein